MLKTFSKGGVHPPDNKISADKKIEILSIPKTVCIPISQHLGAPATAVVKPREKVKVGQLIAQSSGFVSANIHSSVSGTVNRIDDIIDSTGYKRRAVVIDVEGDEWLETIDKSPNLITTISMNSQEIITRISEFGIVGLGGATFPSHVKLSLPKGKTAEVLIINGVECEPYLTSDHRVMLEKSEEMLVGIKILMKALNVNRAIIGIENNKPDAINFLLSLIGSKKDYSGVEVQGLKVKYPQGGEKQLIKALINREVPSGGLPIDVGTVVHNVGTALAVYEAVQKNKPLIERVVTVTGKSLKKTANFLVRIGTPLSELLAAVGGIPENTEKVISGGPMMGKALNSLETPVTKGVSGIVLMDKSESSRLETKTCTRCSRCVSDCPMGLEPYLLMPLVEKSMWERAEEERIMDCIECGSCSYICPCKRPLLDYIRLGKATVGKIIRSRKQ